MEMYELCYQIKLNRVIFNQYIDVVFFLNRSMELSYDGEYYCGKGEFFCSRDFFLFLKFIMSIDCICVFVSLGLVGDISYFFCL